MIRRFFIMLATVVCATSAQAQIPVTDGASIAKSVANQVESVTYFKQQIDQLRSQVQQAQQMYQNVVGTRDIAGILNDKLAQQYLPSNLQQSYQQVRSGQGAAAGISGNLNDIVRANQARDCAAYGDASVQARCKAEWQGQAMNQYVGESGYARASADIDDLQQFVTRIQATGDPKAMQDLQARIQLSQVKVQAEVSKLQYLQQAEKARDEMNRRNSIDNTVKMLKPGMMRF